MRGHSITFRQADVNEILPLRYAVLCGGRPWQEAMFTGDDDASTHHFGAFLTTPHGQGCIGCVSYMRAPFEDEPAWQLRGMAVRPDYAKSGIGRSLVAAAQHTLTSGSPIRLFWCKARIVAIPFYERLGWRVVSDEFVIEHYGPHRKMMTRL